MILLKFAENFRLVVARACLVFSVLFLAACAAGPGPSSYMVETSGPYLLGSGDLVRVTVYGEAELSNEYLIDDSGNIAFPLIGPTLVQGLTTDVAARKIAAALTNGYMRNPDVALEVATYRPFFIQGEVTSPGQYPYGPNLTVRGAISVAGGFNDTADRARAIVYRLVNSEMIKGTVGLDFPLQPGDTIVVLDRWI